MIDSVGLPKSTKSRSDPDSKHKTETEVTFCYVFLDFISF